MKTALYVFGIASALAVVGCGDLAEAPPVTSLADPALCSESEEGGELVLECLPEAFAAAGQDDDAIDGAGILGMCPLKTMDAPGYCWCLRYGQYYTTGRVCTYWECVC